MIALLIGRLLVGRLLVDVLIVTASAGSVRHQWQMLSHAELNTFQSASRKAGVP